MRPSFFFAVVAVACLTGLLVACGKPEASPTVAITASATPASAATASPLPASTLAGTVAPSPAFTPPPPSPLPAPTPGITRTAATPSPNAGGTPASISTSTVTIAGTPVKTGFSAEPAAAVIPACQPEAVPIGGESVGTAPYPTATPVPAFRPPEKVTDEVQAYLLTAGPLSDMAASWAAEVDARWDRAATSQEAAAELGAQGTRLALLCTAATRLPVVPEARAVSSALRAVLRSRHAWLVAASESLACCGSAGAHKAALGADAGATAFKNAAATLHPRATQYGGPSGTGAAPLDLASDVLGISVTLPAGWLPLDDSALIVALAPVESQVMAPGGTGPKAWSLGTAVRVRRLRNPPGQDLAAALPRANTLLEVLGSVQHQESASVNGIANVRQTRQEAATGWTTFVAVTVKGDFTYLVELGCPSQTTDRCVGYLAPVLASVRFI